MFLKRKKPADLNEAARQTVINYKKVFGGDAGRDVLFDLMNKYHVLNSHTGDAYKEGQRSVVLDIMHQCHVDIVALDKLLKGELNG